MNCKLKNSTGFTLIEVVIVTGIMALILTSASMMMIGTMWCYDRETTRTFQDADATTAMQAMITNIREAKTVVISSDRRRIDVILPVVTAEGYYNNKESDTDHPISYYQSDSTGIYGSSHRGTWLWEVDKVGNKRPIIKNLDTSYAPSPDPDDANTNSIGQPVDFFAKDINENKLPIIGSYSDTYKQYDYVSITLIVHQNSWKNDVEPTKLTERVVYMRNY